MIGSGTQRRGFVCSVLSSAKAVAAQRTDAEIQKAFEIALCSHASLNHQSKTKLKPKPTLKSVPELPFSEQSPEHHIKLWRGQKILTSHSQESLYKNPFRVRPPEFIADHSFLSY